MSDEVTISAGQPSARNKAMDFLARREHSEQEIRHKLRSREFDEDAIESAIDGLKEDGLLSDQRFTEAYVYQRFNAGYGPLKIRYELQQKGVDSSLVDACLMPLDDDWQQSMQQQRARKFGAVLPEDYRERMKQARFLQNRGFSPESVMRLFR